MTTTMATVYELYRQHIRECRDEHETITEAQRLYPNSWQAIFTLMNRPLNNQTTAKQSLED